MDGRPRLHDWEREGGGGEGGGARKRCESVVLKLRPQGWCAGMSAGSITNQPTGSSVAKDAVTMRREVI